MQSFTKKPRFRRLLLLGSTGSVGNSVLDVIRSFRQEFEIVGLAAHSNWRTLAKQLAEFSPRSIALTDQQAAWNLRQECAKIRLYAGPDSLVQMVAEEEADLVIVAVSGTAGFAPAFKALQLKKPLALANKEVLVMGGEILVPLAKQKETPIYPLDSEHNALFALLQWCKSSEIVEKLYLTASGGPFLNLPLSQFNTITPEQALRHPTWSMGQKITIDSATLMNKGFELIEAHHLFSLPIERIAVSIHPTSILHGALGLRDGSLLALLGPTDMRIPIANVLFGTAETFLPRITPLDLPQLGTLQFFPVDSARFPAFGLAKAALKLGGTAPSVLNAANEGAVAAFLNKKISFPQIAQTVEKALEAHQVLPLNGPETVLEAEAWARSFTEALL